ncbi:N-acetylmuramoyl-L-alanine amidase [Bacillaceae bacterium IKA-2]|nr:N-acetylmuramoyl-L-alanine amidase [Bacillaceae bacterium IKA-2]
MKRFSVAFLVVFLTVFSVFQFNNQENIVYGDSSRVAVGEVTATILNVRSEPNSTSKMISRVSNGAKISIYETGVNKEWLKIKINNQTAYVHANFVKITETFLPSQANLVKIAEGQVKASNLNVRSEPKTSSQRIGVLVNGTKVDIYETGVNKDWLKIKMGNKSGYVHANFVTINQASNTQAPPSNEIVTKGKVTASTLNVRSKPNMTATRSGTLSSGDQIDIYETGVNKDWLKIKIGSQWGYVHANFVTISKSSNTPAPSPAPAPTPVVTKGQVTASNLNVRSEANMTATRINTLSSGDQVDIYETGVNKDWLKIKIGSQWGYVHANFVTIGQSSNTPAPSRSSPPTPVVTKGQVTASNLNVRSEANMTATRISTLSSGNQVDIYETGVNKDWLKIKIGSQWGYVHASFVNILGTPPNSNASSKLKNKVIVIDPGHGGNDPGAVAFSIAEKNVVLAHSLLLRDKLQQAGAKVVMTRTGDSFLSLSARTKIANNENADMLISIHANSSFVSTATGTEIFWNSNFQSANSRLLATSLQSKLVNSLGTRDRGVKQANFQVIRSTQIPSVLIELGFLTNYNEAKRLADPQFQDQAAEAMLEGIVDYYNN